MKKYICIIFLLIFSIFNSIQVNASSGRLQTRSIKTCNGTTYGYHSDHWHIASKKGNYYYPLGTAIYNDPCNLNNNSSSGDSTNDSSEDNSIDNTINNDSNNNSNGSDSSDNNQSDEKEDSSGDNSTDNTINNDSNNNSTESDSSNNNQGDEKEDSSGDNSTDNIINNDSNIIGDNEDNDIKEESKSNDNTLKAIIIDNTEFKVADNIEYSTINESVNIEVVTNDDKATYQIKNDSLLSIGKNKIDIEVTAEDGSIKNYVININRRERLSSDTGINVIIDGKLVDFIGNKATIYIKSSTRNIYFDYNLNCENSSVVIDEITELKVGDNLINIKVTAEDGTEQNYEIIIHKYSRKEEIIMTNLSLIIVSIILFGIYYIVKKK